MNSTKKYKVLELVVSEEDHTNESTLIAKLSEINDNGLSVGDGDFQFSFSEYSPIEFKYFLLSNSSDKAKHIINNKEEVIVININNFKEHKANIDGEYVDALIHKSLFLESGSIRDIIEGKYRFNRVSKTFAPIDDFPEKVNEIDMGIRVVKDINEPKTYRAYFFDFEGGIVSWDFFNSFVKRSFTFKDKKGSIIVLKSKNGNDLKMTLSVNNKRVKEIILHDLEEEIDRRYFNEE